MVPGYAAFMAGHPIERMDPMTIAGAFGQSVEMYFTWCGRFMGNLVVYLLFMLPKPVYVCFAASCSVLYVVLLHMLIAGSHWRSSLTTGRFLLVAALVWVGLPSFGSAFFWLCIGGYIALLGQVVFLLPYRFAFDAVDKAYGSNCLRAAGMFMLGMVVASLDYPSSVALPVASAFCVTCLVWRQPKGARKIPWALLGGFIGVSIGAALTLMAPGNVGRMAVTTDPEIHAWMALSWGERILSWLLHLPEAFGMMLVPLILLAWACRVFWVQKRSWQFVCALPPAVWLLLLPACATAGSYMFTSWPPPRAFNTVAAQLIVMGMLVASVALPLASQRAQRWYVGLQILLCVFCLASVGQTMQKMWLVHDINTERERTIALHNGGDVVLPPLAVRGDSHMVLGTHLMDITPNPRHWLNRAVAAFYGVKTIALETPAPRKFTISGERAIVANVHGTQLGVFSQSGQFGQAHELHFYYFGVPALLYKAPDFICYPVLRWLGEGKDGDWRLLLVPILLARCDVTLHNQSPDAWQGEDTLWGIEHGHGLWLVRPGGGVASFDILPLQPLE